MCTVLCACLISTMGPPCNLRPLLCSSHSKLFGFALSHPMIQGFFPLRSKVKKRFTKQFSTIIRRFSKIHVSIWKSICAQHFYRNILQLEIIPGKLGDTVISIRYNILKSFTIMSILFKLLNEKQKNKIANGFTSHIFKQCCDFPCIR